jgi:DNA-binding NarL/FixJ family response regulator
VLLGPVAAAQATLTALAGIWALVLIVRQWNQLGRAQSMMHTLTDRVPSKAHARQARLSSREHQVLELIRTGVLPTTR